jgi:hypothetical protein
MAQGSQIGFGFDDLNPAIKMFLESNYEVERFKEAFDDLLLLPKADFVEIMTRNLKSVNGTDDKKKKNKLNVIRVMLGQMFISNFKLDDESYVIGNRTSAIEMANDCWYLSVSIKNQRIENECFETVFRNGSNNRSQLNESNLCEKDQNNRISKLINEVETMKSMIENLLSSNKIILQLNKEMSDELKSIRTENQSLRKLVLEHNANFTINRETRLSEASVDSNAGKRKRHDNDINMNTNADNVFKIPLVNNSLNANKLQANNKRTFASIAKENNDNIPQTSIERRKSTNKTKIIIGKANLNDNGLSVAIRNHHFYVGNLHIDTTINAVQDYINKFAKVEKIYQLKTKHRYYKSYYVEVNEKYNEKMVDACNWPSNVRIKRFFHNKNSKLDEHVVHEDNGLGMEINLDSNLSTINQ